ncbi:PadR family transcriptional regulator [Candidatus Zixiibacteriota bacterium]
MFGPELKKGSVELLVLSMLQDEARHGYQIGKLIELRSSGRLQFNPATLYPVLYRMEDRGWITGTWVEKPGERRRCFYKLTPRGEKVLVEQTAQWKEFSAAIDEAIGFSHA